MAAGIPGKRSPVASLFPGIAILEYCPALRNFFSRHLARVNFNLNDTVSIIVRAVEEQNKTTLEIAGNISRATIGIQEVLGGCQLTGCQSPSPRTEFLISCIG